MSEMFWTGAELAAMLVGFVLVIALALAAASCLLVACLWAYDKATR